MRKHLFCVLVVLFVFVPSAVRADDSEVAVDLFDAMKAGDLNVRFIPANAAKANVLIENKTDRVLHVSLPDAIAAVPVLAQLGPGIGGPAAGPGGGGGGGGSQAVGGALNGGNAARDAGGGGKNGFGLGFMRIAPQKTRKLKATTVCLEHGKRDPHPRMAYQMIPVNQIHSE